MSSGEASPVDPQPPAQTLPLKRRLLVWLIYGAVGVFLILMVLALIGTVTQFSELPECDSQRSRDTMSDVFKEQNISLTKYNEIKTVSTSKDEVTCQASLAIRGGGTLIADYTFYWEDSKAKVRYKLTRQ